jgi:DeoR/GlpR family transcriptional regulator of sugar metabolism
LADSSATGDVSGRRKSRKAAVEAPRQNLLAEPRRMKILEWLQEEGSARVRDLSVAFAVSEATIRQDLERLDTDGFVVREHGGAYLKSMPQQVQSMSLQHLTNMDKKKKIGRAAAALVGHGETIIIDSGSTATEVANNLLGHQNLNVITNAMIKAASKVYLVADSTKIGRTSFSSLGSIDLIHGFITDDGISDADRAEFEKRGIEVIIAR